MSNVSFVANAIWFALGALILYKKQFPIRGTRVITGRSAIVIGVGIMLPGIFSALGQLFLGLLPTYLEEYSQTTYYISQLENLLSIGAWVIVLIAMLTAKWINLEKPKRRQQPLPDVFTVSEAARYLKVEEVYVLHLIEDGDLKAKAIGGDYRISRRSLEDYLQS